MKIICSFCILLNLTVTPPVIVAENGRIEGRVLDFNTGLPVSNANIEILATLKGDVSDSSGFFHVADLPAGTYSVRASRIGYETREEKRVVLNRERTTVVEFSLKPALVELKSVEIAAERLWDKYLTEASLVGVERMRAREIIQIPGAFDDPVKAVQVFSGVSGGGDYSGFLAVRGGSPDQNQVIIDGVVIPNPSRFRLAFGGGLSTINPNLTEDIYLHLGGFSAEYGNSLTSILEVEYRKGNRDRVRTQGTMNLTDVSGIVEGPLPGVNGTFLFSVRRTYYDLIVNQFSKSNSVFPFFYDLQGKLDFEVDKHNRLAISFGRNNEGTELLDEFADDLNLLEEVGADIASIAWTRLSGEQWQFKTILSYYDDHTDYRAFSVDTANKVIEFETIDAAITELSLKENVRYKTGPESWINLGFSATAIPSNIKFTSGNQGFLYARIESPRNIDFDRSRNYYATYVESSTKASDRLHLRIGARYDYSTLIDEGELSPRFTAWYKLSDKTTVHGSWGVFYQYPDPMSIYSRNIPVDLSTNLDIISAEKAVHTIVGIESRLTDGLYAKLELYNKDLDRILLPINDFTFQPTNEGRGIARGFEFILEKKPSTVPYSGMLSYSFGDAKFRTNDRNDWLPFKYDRRHAVTALFNLKLFGNWGASMLGQYSTGLPFTDVIGMRTRTNSDGTTAWDFVRAGRFETRLPDFKKVDVRVSYQRRNSGKALTFYLDLVNLTNEHNVYEITFEKKFLPDGTIRATKRRIFGLPFIPSFGFSFRF